ncbi:MAG: tRNA uridine(34) 5-carboxymethylaminomethyl modification radical SAM/GNAT enzyme Elp3 [Armatimonadetes bacterium]|nr:tRNA uridine(34) 5-carboxymethylaminomethyl modification radical SAM/GNAT enzyme Elp3 [Anaerolineae bacterium]
MQHKALDIYDRDHRATLTALLRAIFSAPSLTDAQFSRLMRRYAQPNGGGLYARSHLIAAYRAFAGLDGLPAYDEVLVAPLRRKPVRTSSGVTPVTVLTKPFPCPGTCIFCPNDVRMPKSYLADEPGAQRAEQNGFDPYLQTYIRLLTYRNNGHPTDKVEMIILGGTWSFYPENYQIWFVKRIFDALHDFGAGIDGREAVLTALDSSQLHPDHAHTTITLHGEDLQQSYNQAVQQIYQDELRRSQSIAVHAQAAERSPVDEYATWDELEAAHHYNEDAPCRCVGLVIETRPDHIDATEVLRIRRLGCTKVQIGFQSLNDAVLRANKRGHNVAATRRAVRLLRQAGFKIHAHWMPNLYGSTLELDAQDYARLFDDPDFRPDELKIYPCSLIASAELMQQYQAGTWRPYAEAELMELLTECFTHTPEYCRLTRVIRDIPGTDIVVGSKATNFRQMVEVELERRGTPSVDIRAREVRYQPVSAAELHLDTQVYATSAGEEAFLQYITDSRDIAGFLRLALPAQPDAPITPELAGAAIIREVHVYGQALGFGAESAGRAQHAGLGTQLIEHAVALAQERGYTRLAVISAVGTRGYYRKRGFTDDGLYQVRAL